jgi:hypothetical protein
MSRLCICMCMNELNFEKQIENKLEVNSNRKKIVTRNVTQLQPAVTSVFKTEILSLPTVRKVTLGSLCSDFDHIPFRSDFTIQFDQLA